MERLKGPTRDRPCPTCGTTTSQTLEPTPEGAGWVCRAAGEGHLTSTYSPDDMISLLRTAAAKLPKREETPRPSTAGLRVFLEHASGEMELDPKFVEDHVELARALPEVGKPMLMRVRGLPAVYTLPYGKVVRIECTSQSK
jgi:hypothetical protein